MNVNWVVIIVIFLFAWLMIKGYKKGFLRIVIGFAGTVAVMLATLIIAPGVSKSLINNSNIYSDIESKVSEAFINKAENTEDLVIPEFLKDEALSDAGSAIYQMTVSTVIDQYIAPYMARLIVKAGTFIFISVTLSLLLQVVLKTSDMVVKLPVLKGVNRILGMAAGGLEALIIVWVAFSVIIKL